MRAMKRTFLVAACAAGLPLLGACNVDVQEQGKDKNVDVRTPFGNINVRSGETPPQTDVPVYPGAKVLREDGEDGGNADVSIGSSFFKVHVAAAKYESQDAPQAIVDFYKDKLSAHGAVTQCSGNIDFHKGSKEPVCRGGGSSSEIQLVAGTEDNHRLVSVKPRGAGSEFAVVAIQIGDQG